MKDEILATDDNLKVTQAESDTHGITELKWQLDEENPYIKSMEEVIAHARQLKQTFFSEPEQAVAEKFMSLDIYSKYLYLRLFCRKPRFLKEDEYSKYLEEDHVTNAVGTLNKMGFIKIASTIADCTSALTNQELNQVSRQLRLPVAKSRNDIIKNMGLRKSNRTISTCGSVEEQILKVINRRYGTIIMADVETMLTLTTMSNIYLCANDTPFNSLVMSKMRMMNFANYIIKPSYHIFSCCQQAKEYFEAANWYMGVAQLDNKQVSKLKERADDVIGYCQNILIEEETRTNIPLAIATRYCKAHFYFRLLLALSELFAQAKDYQKELNCLEIFLNQQTYLCRKRIPVLIRKAHLELFHFYKQNPDEMVWIFRAINSCTDAFFDTYMNDSWRLDLSRKVARLSRECSKCQLELPDFLTQCATQQLKQGNWITITASKVPADHSKITGGKTLWNHIETETGQITTVSVEQCALDYYLTLGYKGYHSESSIATTLFILLFWDVVFATRPDMFFHPCQTHPVDMFMPEFYSIRKEAICDRTLQLKNIDYMVGALTDRYCAERDSSTVVTGINWNFTLEDLIQICQCLGPTAVLQICDILATDYRQYSSGLPDLIIWNYEQRIAKFSEVKSQNDSLSDTQKVWIHLLIEKCGVPVDLCRVLDLP